MSDVYATLFDSGYLHHGLALNRTLQRHIPGARLLALAMDEAALAMLRRLAPPGLEAIAPGDLADPELLALREVRSRAAFCWSAIPSLLLHALRRAGDGGSATYVDADVAILEDPRPELAHACDGGASVFATPHAMGAVRESLFGRYCVQFLCAWDRDPAHGILGRWRREVIAACDDRLVPGRYGDQCRLDRWPRLLGAGLAEPRDPLAFAAPWNASAGARRPITYHFHQWRLRSPDAWRWIRNHRLPGWALPVYRDYQTLLESCCRELLATDPGWRPARCPAEGGHPARLRQALRRRIGWERDQPIADHELRRLLGAG